MEAGDLYVNTVGRTAEILASQTFGVEEVIAYRYRGDPSEKVFLRVVWLTAGWKKVA